MKADKEFICKKCKKEFDEICSFSGYGDEKAKLIALKGERYCEDCFDVKFEEIFKRKALRGVMNECAKFI